MGIHTDSKMLLGNEAHNFLPKLQEEYPTLDLYDWCEENGMGTTSPYYDSSEEDWDFGFEIKPVKPEELTQEWLSELKTKAAKFKELTGLEAKLMSVANVT